MPVFVIRHCHEASLAVLHKNTIKLVPLLDGSKVLGEFHLVELDITIVSTTFVPPLIGETKCFFQLCVLLPYLFRFKLSFSFQAVLPPPQNLVFCYAFAIVAVSWTTFILPRRTFTVVVLANDTLTAIWQELEHVGWSMARHITCTPRGT
mgnify:CR=1 FL=1